MGKGTGTLLLQGCQAPVTSQSHDERVGIWHQMLASHIRAPAWTLANTEPGKPWSRLKCLPAYHVGDLKWVSESWFWQDIWGLNLWIGAFFLPVN